MPITVAPLIERDFPFAVRPAGNDRHAAFMPEHPPQGVGVITFVGDEMVWQASRRNQGGCGADVRDIAWREYQRIGAAYRVGEGVDLGGLTAPRRPDCLIFRPPFPPWAARWAFT